MAYIIYSDKVAFGKEMLDKILDWIVLNLDVDQVYSGNKIVNTVIRLPELYGPILRYIAKTETPEDVFSVDKLEEWAAHHFGEEP